MRTRVSSKRLANHELRKRRGSMRPHAKAPSVSYLEHILDAISHVSRLVSRLLQESKRCRARGEQEVSCGGDTRRVECVRPQPRCRRAASLRPSFSHGCCPPQARTWADVPRKSRPTVRTAALQVNRMALTSIFARDRNNGGCEACDYFIKGASKECVRAFLQGQIKMVIDVSHR